jgi:hypothetical protein
VGTSGSPTQTVNLGTAISAISYTATASATFTKIGSTFPSGLNVSNSGSSYTIYGQPSATGTFGYSLTASANGCTSAAAVGTITVNAASVIDPPYAASAQTWSFGGLTWSDVIQVPECDKTTMIVSVTTPDCRSHTEGGRTFYYYNWRYVYEHKLDMCAEPWRVPGYYEGPLAIGDAPSSIVPEWALGGQAYGTTISNVGVLGAYWPIGICCQNENLAYGLWISGVRLTDYLNSADGLQVRCVKD